MCLLFFILIILIILRFSDSVSSALQSHLLLLLPFPSSSCLLFSLLLLSLSSYLFISDSPHSHSHNLILLPMSADLADIFTAQRKGALSATYDLVSGRSCVSTLVKVFKNQS